MRTEGDHIQVSENVFDNLPAWQQTEWRDVRKAFTTTYSYYVDNLAPVSAPEKCSAIEPRYREMMYVDGVYCHGALGSGSHRMAPLMRYSGDFGGDYIITRAPFERVFGQYLTRLTEAMRRRDHDTAAKYAGIVSHLFCDRHPGDHIDPGMWIGMLCPPPPEIAQRVTAAYWGVTTQEVDIPPVRYTPRLLGTGHTEAINRFFHRYLMMMKHAIPYVSLMLREAYAGRQAEAQRLLSESRLMGIEIISDFLYTAFCLAYERCEPAEVEALNNADITEWFADENEMDYLYFYGPYTENVIDLFPATVDGKIGPHFLPAELLVAPPGGGATVARPATPCLAVLPDSGCQLSQRWAKLVYELPEGVYRRFTSLAGPSARITVNAKNGARSRVKVQVLGDETVLFERPLMQGGDPAVDIAVDIAGRKKLTLLVNGLQRNADEFWCGHFIWGRPVLHKR